MPRESPPPPRAFDNRDMLAWYAPEERQVCGACSEAAVVSGGVDAVIAICLACSAVWWNDGTRLDIERDLSPRRSRTDRTWSRPELE
jgi:hypothetical protein